MSNNEPIVTFVAISYREEWEPYMFIGMLKCLKNPRWKAIIWHDGPNEEMKKAVESFKDDRIIFIQNDQNKGSWGCHNRIASLDIVDTEYIIQTTVQEYYLPVLIDEIIANKANDLIYWPCIHHSFGYNILNAEPVRGQMDWSNFALKTHIAKKVGINYFTSYVADGLFIEDVIKSGLVKKKVKLNRILNIKN
jgi:hypothetical protein